MTQELSNSDTQQKELPEPIACYLHPQEEGALTSHSDSASELTLLGKSCIEWGYWNSQ